MNLNLIKNNNENIFIFSLLFLVFFSETILLDTLVPAYILIIIYLLINLSKIKISLFQYVSIIVTIFYFTSVLILSPSSSSALINFKYFFGFIIFLLFFKNFNFKKKHFFIFRSILFLICSYTLIESLIINIYPDISLHQEIHTAKFFGFYTRSYGIGGNSTISSLSIIFLYYFIFKFYKKKLSFFENIQVLLSIISLFSTSGFLMLFLIIIIENIKFKNINDMLKLFIVTFLFFILIYTSTHIKGDNFQKISFDYLVLVINDKLYWYKMLFEDKNIENLNQLYSFKKYYLDALETKDCYKLLYGCQVLDPTPNTSGDFAIKIFIKQNGLMGLFSYLLLITSFFCSKNYLIVAILFLTSLHYGFIFSNVGHFILPLFLIFSLKKYNLESFINAR